jgi:hypothetical protein
MLSYIVNYITSTKHVHFIQREIRHDNTNLAFDASLSTEYDGFINDTRRLIMKTRTSPVVLGFIWGLFSMLLSFAVVSIFASLQVVFTGFPLFAYNGETQYMIIAAVFLLSVLGAIGSGLVSRLPKLGGFFILLSCCGVALLMFAPVLMQSFSFEPLEAYGIKITPLALLIADFTLIIFTVIGLAGGILAFIPKKNRKAVEPFQSQAPYSSIGTIPTRPSTPATVPPVPAQSPVTAVITSAAPPDAVQASPPTTDIDLMDLE